MLPLKVSDFTPELCTLEGSSSDVFELLTEVKNIFIFYLMTLLGNVRNYSIIPSLGKDFTPKYNQVSFSAVAR